MVKTVLIADDEEDIRAVIGMRLHKFHYRVLHATNGAQAIELAIKEFPDLLVLDWTLPGMNGAAVMTALRQNPATAGIPVIVMTGMDEPAEKAQALAMGASAYLVKPASMHALEKAIENIFGRR